MRLLYYYIIKSVYVSVYVLQQLNFNTYNVQKQTSPSLQPLLIRSKL